MAKILYIGNGKPSSTSFHRKKALERLGYDVVICDLYSLIPKNPFLNILHYRTGYKFLQSKLATYLKEFLKTIFEPDLIWVDSGELIGIEVFELFSNYKVPKVLYNVDDPTGVRDGARFSSLLKVIDKYDLVVVVREETYQECLELGCKNVLKVFRSYDEIEHRPFENRNDIPNEFKSDVAFIGTWMHNENRDKFLLFLVQNKIPISIWGDRWHKSPHWNHLKPYYRGGALSGRDYVAAIQGAKVCLGLLSKGNRDLHTQRSLEIPYAHGLFCAERTSEHIEMYEEGIQAVFWKDADECVRVCKTLLQNDSLIDSIKSAGSERVKEMHVGNEDICRLVVNKLLKC